MYRKIWNEEYYFNDNVINVHIRRLRKKIEEDPSDPGKNYCDNVGIPDKLGNINVNRTLGSFFFLVLT